MLYKCGARCVANRLHLFPGLHVSKHNQLYHIWYLMYRFKCISHWHWFRACVPKEFNIFLTADQSQACKTDINRPESIMENLHHVTCCVATNDKSETLVIDSKGVWKLTSRKTTYFLPSVAQEQSSFVPMLTRQQLRLNIQVSLKNKPQRQDLRRINMLNRSLSGKCEEVKEQMVMEKNRHEANWSKVHYLCEQE